MSLLKLAEHLKRKNANVLGDEKLKELSKIESFTKRIEFAKNNFKHLSSGSSRIVYDYKPGLILKLAKNEKGLQQNSTEADGFIQQNYKNIIANVIDSDPDDKWMIVQKADKISPLTFETLTNIPFKLYCDYISFRLDNKSKKENDPSKGKLSDNDFINDILDMAVNFSMPAGDLARISSYGEVENKVVLTDYGLTNQIYDDYYKNEDNLSVSFKKFIECRKLLK